MAATFLAPQKMYLSPSIYRELRDLIGNSLIKKIFIASLIVTALPAMALNQCMDSLGKKVYSDLPCASVGGAKEVPLTKEQAKAFKESPPTQWQIKINKIANAPTALVKAFNTCARAVDSNSFEFYYTNCAFLNFEPCKHPITTTSSKHPASSCEHFYDNPRDNHTVNENRWAIVKEWWEREIPKKLVAVSGGIFVSGFNSEARMGYLRIKGNLEGTLIQKEVILTSIDEISWQIFRIE